jgi:hypothetical protein
MNNQFIIVIDFDETIGFFSDLYKFWYYVKIYLNTELTYKYLYKLLDKYPLFFRPGILDIFKYIKNKKKNNVCNKVILYTNNKGSAPWITKILNYINFKIDYNLFDYIIQNIDTNKSYSTLNKLLVKNNNNINLHICFIDDNYHPEMINKNILYINIKPYIYNTNFSKLCKYFYNNNRNLFTNIVHTEYHFTNYILSNINNYNNYYNTIDKKYNLIISKKIKNNIKVFLNNNKKTYKTSKNYKNKTKKNYLKY